MTYVSKRSYDSSRIVAARLAQATAMEKQGFETMGSAAARANVVVQHLYNLKSQGKIPTEALVRDRGAVYVSIDWVNETFGLES